MASTRMTLRQLMAEHPDGFHIASYQRHYVWGQHRSGEKDATAFLTAALIKAYRRERGIFLQGITATATHELIDGQQRITYLYLLLRHLGYRGTFRLTYSKRDDAQQWLAQEHFGDITENIAEESQDIYFFKHTLRVIRQAMETEGIDIVDFTAFLLDKVHFLYIGVDDPAEGVQLFTMMNGAKSQMLAADIIKADLMRLASDERQPNATDWELNLLSERYAAEWDKWQRWWRRTDVSAYYSIANSGGLELLLSLCLCSSAEEYSQQPPLTYERFRRYIIDQEVRPYHAAKHFFSRLRHTQRRFEDAYIDTASYNRIRAIMLMQKPLWRRKFLYSYFVERDIDVADLERYYKLSFLGMTIDEIARGDSPAERFDDLLATLSMADVYHSEAKRDVFHLLLRLNIDEDTKLGRKFDFSVWGNRSLEHIFSKSKVWHKGADGKLYDGNDNLLRGSEYRYAADKSFMPRSAIVNLDGTQLSEHCIGNLVLLYGRNNADFGNAGFSEKKEMFLRPGDQTVFQSRNLLHSVCVFAGNRWDEHMIVDNYNTILKNLKIYYGYK